MSDDTVIADVGETLIRLLRDNMTDLINPDTIVLLSPADVEDQNIRLTLFLYSVMENAFLRNQHMRDVDASHQQYPPLSLDLYYLLTSYASAQIQDRTERTLEEHRLLGRAMQVLYDHAIVRGSALQGSLAGTSDELRLVLNPLSLEDLNRIWSVFPNRSYRPSISYMVTPVTIDSTRTTETRRVIARHLEYVQMRVER
jgi:Pvc16 N-terminal domain